VTREHSHPEKSDVEVSVAKESLASEDRLTPASLEMAAPAEAQTTEGMVEGYTPPSARESVAASAGDEPARPAETPTRAVRESAATYEPAPIAPSYESEAATTVSDRPSFGESSFLPFEEGRVRPFSEFIEEFRQAEEARQATTLEVVYKALDVLASPTAQEGGEAAAKVEEQKETKELERTAGTERSAQAIGLPEAPRPEGAETLPITPTPTKSLPIPGRLSFVGSGPGAATTTPPIESIGTAPAAGAVSELPSELPQAAPAAQPEQQPAAPPAKPAERPLSPLLRPATRIRLPRYGRLREPFFEERPLSEAERSPVPANEGMTPPPAAPAAAPGVSAGGELENTGSGEGSVAVPGSEEEQATRPARRYRFDRPATPANSALFLVNATQGAAPEQSKELAERGATGGRAPEEEQAISPAAAVPEVPAEQASERRKQSKEKSREKEQEQPVQSIPPAQPAQPVQPAQPAQPAAAVNAQSQQTTNGARPAPAAPEAPAPEDLPPLEYAEIQAVTARRRRRRRSKAAAAAEPPPSPMSPPPTPVAPVSVPPISQPAAPTGPYNIISGYTVNQMNLGNEFGGPFMAPEPSPARGSVAVREAGVRPSRSDVQRNNLVYPSRSSDPMSQFANTVVQAIQSQTDRIVAELRRSNQSPTNVSVSIPPPPSTERVGVFVDVANLLYSARTLRLTIDFGKLLDFLRGNRRLVRAHAYCPTSPQPGDEQMFLQAVKGLGYRITTKNYKTFSSGAKKADLDLDLCMDVVRLVESRAVDCIVLVSGDSDFMPMLDYCSDHGVRVEVAAFDEAMSATLRQSCDLFINLSMLEEIRA
jgi:uncharacterized LabA/DUF88 family protein